MKPLLILAGVLTPLIFALADEKRSDQQFVVKASAGGMAEVKFGKLAMQNARADSVKDFGQKMVRDHTKANAELSSLASKLNLNVAASMDGEHAKMYEKLEQLKGVDFDQKYMAGQVKDHETTIALFEKQARDGSNTELSGWARKTLPHLREHLKMAKQISSKLDDGGNRSRR